MAFDNWPVTLPQQILMDNNNYVFGDGRMMTQPDVGPPIVYPRSMTTPDEIHGHMFMSTTQYTALVTFGKTTLLKWSLAFNFADPVTGATIQCMFAQLPRVVNVSGHKYDVSIDLLVMP